MLGSTKNIRRCADLIGAVLCRRGRITSMLDRSVLADILPPALRSSLLRRTSSSTLLRVASLAEIYGLIGRLSTSWLGRMAARFIGSRIDFRSSLRGLRLPKAVMGSAMRLGRGTNGTFSQSTSRLCVVHQHMYMRAMETIYIGSVIPNIFYIYYCNCGLLCSVTLCCRYCVIYIVRAIVQAMTICAVGLGTNDTLDNESVSYHRTFTV